MNNSFDVIFRTRKLRDRLPMLRLAQCSGKSPAAFAAISGGFHGGGNLRGRNASLLAEPGPL
jgi:hypothetical protein